MFAKYKTTILLVAILILAAVLRLYKIGDYMTFLGDEGRDLLAVLQILKGDLVFLGPRSSAADFYYGPIYFYLITPFLWLFNYDPAGPAAFIGLLGVATVYLVYKVGKDMFGTKGGIVASALYAVSPLVISYSRSSWNPNPLPFIALLSLYITHKAITTKRLKLFLILGILMGIAIQLQYLALFLFAIIFFFIIIGYFITHHESSKKNKTESHTLTTKIKELGMQYVAIAGGFIIGWSPFLAFELKNGFPNLRTILTYVITGGDKSIYPDNMGFAQNIYSVFFKLFGRLVTRFPPPEQVNLNENIELRIWQIVTLLLGVASVFALYKVKNKLTVVLFSLWVFLGCFLFGFYKKEIYDYYLGFMFPLPFLLIGNLFEKLSEIKKFTIAKLKGGFLLSLILFSALFLYNLDGNPFKYIPNRQKDQVRSIAEFVLSKTDGKPYNFALLTKGNSDHGYRYFFEINKRPPVVIEDPQKDPERKSITDQLLIVCEYPECQPLGDPLWEVAGFGRAEITGEWQVSVVKVYRLVHYKE